MILSVIIFFLALEIFATLASSYYALRIAWMKVTPSGTWYLLAAGFFGILVLKLQGVYWLFNTAVIEFVNVFNPWLIYGNNVIESVARFLIFIGIVKIHSDLKAKFAGITKAQLIQNNGDIH